MKAALNWIADRFVGAVLMGVGLYGFALTAYAVFGG